MNENIWFVPHAALTALSMPAPLCLFSAHRAISLDAALGTWRRSYGNTSVKSARPTPLLTATELSAIISCALTKQTRGIAERINDELIAKKLVPFGAAEPKITIALPVR
jgi:hypothetical protein